MDYTNTAYNSMFQARKLPMNIVDYLFDNAENLWKLLFYSQSTVNKPPVSNSDKSKMIARTTSGDSSTCQVF